MSDWFESTEGDLDPDLTEEAGYGDWEPRRRAWWPVVFQSLALLVIVSIVGTAVLVAIR
jgi:hypothetical protein